MSNTQAPLEIEDLFKKVSFGLLKEFCEGHRVAIHGQKANSKIAPILVKKLILYGVEILLEGVVEYSKDLAKSAIEQLGEKIEGNAASTILKALKTIFAKSEDPIQILAKLNQETLEKFAAVLEFKVKPGTSKDVLEKALNEEILIQGAYHSFDKMSKDFITDFAKELGLKYTLGARETIYLILNECYPHLYEEFKAEKEKLTKDQSEEKKDDKKNERKIPLKVKKVEGKNPWEGLEQPEIKKGITAEEIHNAYWTDQLVDYCKKHEIVVGKKKNKPSLIKAIVKFVNEGVKESGKRKKKGETGPNKKAKKEAKPEPEKEKKPEPEKKVPETKAVEKKQPAKGGKKSGKK